MNQYIVFEGIDGSGKTTHSEALVERLKSAGHKAVWTREPGSPLIELNVRDFVLGHGKIAPQALELLMQSDRAEHTTKVKQLLADGYWVISDRSFMSGLAYGVACGNDVKHIWNLLSFAIQTYPSTIFYMDITVEEANRRREERGSKATREEAKGNSFTEKVLSNFRSLCKDLNELNYHNGRKYAINRYKCDFLGEVHLGKLFPKVVSVDASLPKNVLFETINKEIEFGTQSETTL